jgi:hypothetical protein
MSAKFEPIDYGPSRAIHPTRVERQWLARVVNGEVEKRLVWGVFWKDDQVCTSLSREFAKEHLDYPLVEEVMES